MVKQSPVPVDPAASAGTDDPATDAPAPGQPTASRPAPRAVPASPSAVHDEQSAVPDSLRVAATISWRFLVLVGALVVVLWLLDFFLVLVIPLLIAVLLAALTLPLVELAVRYRLPRGVAVALTLLLVIGILMGLFTLVGTQLASGFAGLSSQATAGFLAMQSWLANGPLDLSNRQIDTFLEQARGQISANSEEIAARAVIITATAGEIVTGAFLVFFSLIFLLLEGNKIWGWLVRLFPQTVQSPVDCAGRDGWGTLTSYVRASILVASADAIGIGVGAALLGVPLAIPLAVLVFLGAFVPIVGALVSGGVAVLVALVALGPVKALAMLGVVILVQQLEAHVLQPLLLGRAVSVHPLAVVLAIGAGLLVAGIVGALFSVPLVAFLNTVVHSLRGRQDTWVTELERLQVRVDLRRHADRVRRRRP